MTPSRVIAIMGPTASGKTGVAEAVADRLGARLLNADAFQIYRGMDIGTAKSPRAGEYAMMNIVDPDENFGVGRWVELARAEIAATLPERPVVIVGGTGLYIRALSEGYDAMAAPPDPALRAEIQERLDTRGLDALVTELTHRDPAAAARIDLKNPRRVQRALERTLSPTPRVAPRPPLPMRKIGLDPERTHLGRRIEIRVRDMVHNGWVQEVQRLAERGYGPSDPGFRAHGYRAMVSVLRGEVGLEEAIVRTALEVRQYAKRQRTWLNTEPNLIRESSPDRALAAALAFE